MFRRFHPKACGASANAPTGKRRVAVRKYVCGLLATSLVTPGLAAAAPDPLFSEQWALSDPNAIGASEAKTQSSGAGVLVAVLDSGLEIEHPDLVAAVWTNPREVAGNGRDDDANGIVDDVHGANMLDLSGNIADDNGHGTHVAGIIAAGENNGIGGAGIAPGTTILPVKVLDSTMSGDTDALARAIRYAVDQGAKILNASVNGDTPTAAVAAAVRYAGEHGAVLVASAGNNGRDIDLLPSFPASLSDPAVLSVAAVDSGGQRWAQSNSGALSVDVAAPGVRIVSTAWHSSFQSRSGTSASAPFVAGAMALLSAARPDLPASALRDVIIASARRTNVFGSQLAGGLLDVGAAMHSVRPGASWQSSHAADTASPNAVPTLRLRTPSKARAGSRVTLRWSARRAEHVSRWRVSLDGRVLKSVTARTAKISRRIAGRGRHKWRVVGFDAGGAKVVAALRTFRVTR